MANFKIISIKVLEPQDEFLKWNKEQLANTFGNPLPRTGGQSCFT